MKRYKLYIFDLDGVIFDTKSNMRASWTKVQKKHKISIKFEDYFSLIGAPFNNILSELGIYNYQNQIAKTYSNVSRKKLSLVKIYPKVSLILKKLKSESKIAVVTSKDRKRTNFFLKKFKLKFDFISCPEKNLKGKPYPDQILKVLKKLAIKKKYSVYIGDMLPDYKASKKAKVNFILANYGYGNHNLKTQKKIKTINKISDLLKINNPNL